MRCSRGATRPSGPRDEFTAGAAGACGARDVRIYLQTPAATEGGTPRFYHLMLLPDLWEGWTLVREWGLQGGAGRVRREHFPTRERAEQALIAARDHQLRRGYRVVFVEGGGG